MADIAADIADAEPIPTARVMPMTGWRRTIAYLIILSSAPFLVLIFAALGPMLPMMAEHFNDAGNGAFAAQMVMTMPAVGIIVGGAVGGFLIERLGLRPVLLGAAAVYGVAGSAGLYLEDIWTLLASRLLMGIAVASFSTCVILLVSAWFDGVARARILGFQQGSAGVIAVPALLLSGKLAEQVGWRAPFAIYLIAFLVLIAAAIVIPSVPVAPRRSPGAKPQGSLLSLWPVYGLQIVLMLAYFMSSIQLTFLLADDGVKSAVTRSAVIAVGTMNGGIAGFTYGLIFARMKFRWTRVFFIALMAIGSIVIGLGHSLALVIAGVVLLGFGGGMINPYMNGVMLVRAPIEIRARALAFTYTALYTADFLNPVIVAPLRQTIGIHGAFLITGILLVVLLLAIWRRSPIPRQSENPDQPGLI